MLVRSTLVSGLLVSTLLAGCGDGSNGDDGATPDDAAIGEPIDGPTLECGRAEGSVANTGLIDPDAPAHASVEIALASILKTALPALRLQVPESLARSDQGADGLFVSNESDNAVIVSLRIEDRLAGGFSFLRKRDETWTNSSWAVCTDTYAKGSA
jgi:hypothetical protein